MSMLEVKGFLIKGHEITGIMSPDEIVDYYDEKNSMEFICELCSDDPTTEGPLFHSLDLDDLPGKNLVEYCAIATVKGEGRETRRDRHAICKSCLSRIYNYLGLPMPRCGPSEVPKPVVYEVLLEDNFSGISIKKHLFIDRQAVINYIAKKIPTDTKDGQISRFTVNVYEVGESNEG